MTTYVALLRGINVGGSHKLPMADCRAYIGEIGGTDVVSYIQSGNLVFDHDAPESDLAPELTRHLGERAGFPVPVMLRAASAWAGVVARNPFGPQPHTALHVAFLAEPPAPEVLGDVDWTPFLPSRIESSGRELYLFLPDGVGRSKLVQRLGRLPLETTMRNWRTVEALTALLAERP